MKSLELAVATLEYLEERTPNNAKLWDRACTTMGVSAVRLVRELEEKLAAQTKTITGYRHRSLRAGEHMISDGKCTRCGDLTTDDLRRCPHYYSAQTLDLGGIKCERTPDRNIVISEPGARLSVCIQQADFADVADFLLAAEKQ